MKLVVAVIRPEQLESVQEALGEPGVSLLSVSKAVDTREPSIRGFWRGLEVRVPSPRLRLEVAVVNEALVSSTVRAIAQAAALGAPGRRGEGDVMVMPMTDHLRLPIADPEAWVAEEDEEDDVPPSIAAGRA